MFKNIAALLGLVPFVLGQAAMYGQCGGQSWTGTTTCVSGAVCTYSNAYYSQCLPAGSGSVSSSATSTKSVGTTSTKSVGTTSTKSVGTTSVKSTGTATSTGSSSTSTSSAGNPFAGTTLFLSPPYAAEVAAGAAAISDATLAAKAAKVAEVPTFIWFDQVAKVPNLSTYLASAQKQGPNVAVPIVVYDLPDRDCAAAASNGEFSYANNGSALYENYINQIAAAVKEYPSVPVIAVIEPDSLANLVTNLNVQKCANAQSGYLASVTYAIQTLSAAGVHMYLDAGHAGWLGWPANLSPAAQLFSSLYTKAGSPSGVRGLATNVANYNAFNTTKPDPITQGNPNYDEWLYIQALAPLLESSGFPAHFIVDQSRSGVQDLRQQWGDWCNVKGSGFGIRPSTNTGTSLVDSFVWVKPGGECDGTSNTTAPRYDFHCSLSDADQPAPQAGTWFQEFFQTLVANANPSF